MATKNNPIESIEQTFIDPYGLAGQSTYDNQKGTWTDALTGKTGRASQPFGVGLTDQLEQMAKQNDAASRQALQSATSAANSAARDAQSAHTQALKALDSLTSTYENQINQEMRRRQQEAERVRKAQEKAQREAEAARVKAAKQVAKASSVRELPQDVLGRIPKFDPSSIQGWSRLTHPDRQRYYDAYAKSVADGIKSVNSNLDDADINSYISELNRDTRPVMQERSWSETLSDWGNLIAAGVDKVQQSAWYDLIDPSSDAAKANRAERQAHLNNLSYQTRSEMRENEIRSEEAKAAGDTGFWAWLQNVRNSPMAAITQDGAEAAAGIGLIGAGALGTLASGGTAAGAAIPAVAAGANILYGAASSAGGLRGDIYQRIHAADDAYLQSSSADYRELRKTMSENAAKDALGSRVTDHLPELVTAATVGAVMERFGLGRLGTADAVGAMATQGLRAAAGRVGREAASEGIEEGVQQAAANYGFRRYDTNQSLTEDVLLSAGVGATMGGGMAAGLNAGMAVANRGRPDTTSDAAVQQTAIGDIGFTEDAGDATPAAPVQEMSSQIIENADGTMTRVVRNETGAWEYDPQIPTEFNPRSPEADAFIAAQSANDAANLQSDATPAVDAPAAADVQAETATSSAEVETAPAAEVVTPDSDVASSADSAVAALSSANRMSAAQPSPVNVATPAADTAVDADVAAAISGLTETAARAVEASVRTEQAVAETAAEQTAELGRIAGLVRDLSLSDRQAIAASSNPAVVQSPVYQAIVQAGVESAMVEGNSWADSIFSGAAANPLAAVQDNQDSAGIHNAAAARAIINAFRASGIPLPNYTLSGGVRQGARGSYVPSTHTVNFNRGVTTANTVTHEYFHALTVPGIEVMQQAARNGDADAQTFLSALSGIHSFLKSKADGQRYYGNANPAEMMAEIVRPEFMNYASRFNIDDAVSEGFVTEREVAFMREYAAQPEDAGLLSYIRTLAQIAVRAANSMLGRNTNPEAGSEIDNSVANAVSELSAIAASAGGREQPATVTADAATAQDYYEEDTRPHVNESGSFDSVTDPIADDVIPDASTQRDAVEFINDVEAGRSVASSYWRTTAGDAIRQGTAKQATKKLVRDLVSKADEVFADSIRPFRNWVNTIADAGHIGEREVNRIMGSLYRASSYRDALLRRMRDEWGLEQVEEVINDIANKSKISRATAIEWAGMWMSATYAPEATMHILNRNARENARRQSEADALQERLDGMTQGAPEYAAVETELRNLQREIKDIAEDMRKMLAAANDPTVRRKALHEVGGGMNFATAAKIRQVIENKIDVEQLRKLHEPMRKMMAYRLAMDVESGKTTVSKMVEFTGKPELRALGNALVAASQAADSKVDGAMQRLDDARDAFAAAAESNYVPLTGNPEHAMSVELFGMDNFGQQSRAPNGGRNFRMEGRKELPDSAVKAAMSAAISSATFAGYKSFGDQIAKLHNSLSPAQRDQFGLHASALREDQTYPANSIIVRRNGRTTAYHLTDATAFEALRKGNLEMQRNALGEMIGGVTKKMAWLMTQGNPYFIARQIIQDGWERGTTLMGKELYDKDGNKIDSTAVSRHMRNLLINPFSLAKLANAALSVAFNRNKLMSRVFQADPYTANMIKELLNEGGISTRASMFAYSSADMERSMQRNRKTAANIAKLAVTDFMESANNAVEYTTALAAYMAMREFGMSKADAIDTQLDLSNFRKKGTANAAFAPLWAFAQPAFMGGSNLISSAFDRKGNPKAKTFKYLASRIVILLIIQSIARALADDNEGGDTIDQMNHYTLASRLPIPLGNGTTFDIPLGFGLARVANSAARGVLNIGTGEGSVRDLAAGVMADGIISGISPIQPSEIDPQKRPAEWALATFMPTVFKPITEVAVNRNSFDGRIVNNANPKKDQYNWQQYGGNTSEFWRDIAKAVHSATGIDLAPEQTRHLVRGYLPGVPSSMMREFVDRPYAKSIGRDAGNSFFEPFNRLNAEAAINGQFNKMNEEIEDLLKVRAANPAAFHADSEQAQLIAAYESWKKRNDALAGRMRSITRSPMSEEAKKQARANVGEQRTEESRRMLAEYRRIKGLEYSQTK